MLKVNLKLKDNKILIEPFIVCGNKDIDLDNYVDSDYCKLNSIKQDLVYCNKIYLLFNNIDNLIFKSNNKYISHSSNFFQLLNIFNKISTLSIDEKLEEIKSNSLSKVIKKKYQEYSGLSKKLIFRDYQNFGINWMLSLAQLKSGCILADDMGLGKTVQVIGLISRMYQNNIKKPILIACPLSVIANWKNELNKFTNYNYEEYQGKDKNSYFINPSNILLTSYNSLSNSIEKFKNVNYSLCIFDEGQKLKNYKSFSAIAAAQLNSDSKIILSGTPVENNWLELWSLFNIINPGLLSKSVKTFKKNFLNEIDKNVYEPKQLLFNKTKYFILTRSKKNVLKELPPKIYHNKISSLSESQILCYKEILNDNSLDPLVKFSKLLQITSHPSLYNDEYKKDTDSGKFNSLIEILNNLNNKNEKIILFVRYNRLIDIIQKLNKKYNFNFMFINGSIDKSERNNIIEKFNNSSSNELLVLTYQTSALGININTASSIIHYDRWWNPAIENQAEDRAYRLGRKDKLFVYKLNTHLSLDDKILKLHEEKSKMLNDILTKGTLKNIKLINSLLDTLKDEIRLYK